MTTLTIDQMIYIGLTIYAFYGIAALSAFLWERGEFKKLTGLFTKQVKRYE